MMRLVSQILILLAIAALIGTGWYLAGNQGEPMAGQAGQPGGGPRDTVVEVAEPQIGTVTERIESVGTARAREAIEIVTEVSGRIARINFEEGQPVAAGDVLVELDVTRERAELREAQAMRNDIRMQLDRARQLLQSRNISQARVDELTASVEAAEARVAVVESRIRDRQIRVPFDGVVGLREVSTGAYVEPQRRITTLDDISSIRVDFSVPERFLGRLAPGLTARASSPAFAGNAFEGVVTRIDTRVDPVTRTIRVQSEFPNSDGRLRPGMFMSMELVLETREALILPEEAIVAEGDRQYVYVVEDGVARRVYVATGIRRVGEVEIREGLELGQRVVTAGQPRLRDGAAVRVLGDPVPTS